MIDPRNQEQLMALFDEELKAQGAPTWAEINALFKDMHEQRRIDRLLGLVE